ncbi:MAG: CiaD-like domain-containing protein [Sulfuricurvum sp.]
MELKDVILSTLAELEECINQNNTIPLQESMPLNEISADREMFKTDKFSTPFSNEKTPITVANVREDETRLLEGIRERLLVLFEGFQSPNNVQIEAKVDLTLNFLEYLLATIDNRLESFKEK